ncbi:Protein LONG AFTER FAR-RED 3 [Psilocybe cubensis]|uniref:Protein LONG AFTER FAR-RED 3 n=1 Tax=Psilocybe cubensis TaxID=181762 RepID=A0ACB8HAL8_PSICU|nr:Protein LONG AFTER FAR-RED 3 [Psilocybe cubensis]KAH9484702.1 Protein LONG AFTER FAR-RED 3 [Psilocybe cubensis]
MAQPPPKRLNISDAYTIPQKHKAFSVTRCDLRIVATTVVLLFATWYAFKGDKHLPQIYALCSLDGRKIYTVDSSNSVVQCVLIHKSHVAATGDLDDIRKNAIDTVKTHSVAVRYLPRGSIMIPGISDSHCHILEYGASRQIPLSTGKTLKETVSLVRDYVVKNPDIEHDRSRVVEGWGWDHASWDVERWPSWEDLEADPQVAGRPVILQSRDGHALWVSKDIIKDNAPYPDDIEGGFIFRDEEGNPTGIFMDSAQDLIKRRPPGKEELERRFRTTVGEALAIRVYGMSFFDQHGQYWGDVHKPVMASGNGRLSAKSVKIFADGALRSGGAALYEPYSDNPSTRGVMRITAESLNKVIPRFLKDGWQVNVHAIGDRANGIVLDAFEASLKGVNVSALRPRLEHAQILTKNDMMRLGKLGVIASIQPTHAISDMWFAEDRLGSERVKGLYAFRSILESGARITLGSDFPVEEINPLKGFYAAVTRLTTEGTSPHGPGGWFPEQRLTRIEALRGMTIDPAYASFTEDTLGSLVPGKRADLVVLSQDIMTIATSSIMKTSVIATFLDGRPVYGKI